MGREKENGEKENGGEEEKKERKDMEIKTERKRRKVEEMVLLWGEKTRTSK